jgi:hypothetical protein
MDFRNDPDGRRLPVKLDTTTNGEYAPIPLEPVHREARHNASGSADAAFSGLPAALRPRCSA